VREEGDERKEMEEREEREESNIQRDREREGRDGVYVRVCVRVCVRVRGLNAFPSTFRFASFAFVCIRDACSTFEDTNLALPLICPASVHNSSQNVLCIGSQ
jgi:hypothetical protein